LDSPNTQQQMTEEDSEVRWRVRNIYLIRSSYSLPKERELFLLLPQHTLCFQKSSSKTCSAALWAFCQGKVNLGILDQRFKSQTSANPHVHCLAFMFAESLSCLSIWLELQFSTTGTSFWCHSHWNHSGASYCTHRNNKARDTLSWRSFVFFSFFIQFINS
jgi:hypothetical protein